jgi:diguanylate cyclase (GGDEF)-like protein/PAS domain S-box-containing protein
MLVGKTKILIVGAGKKGSLLVSVFHKSRTVNISGVVDVYADAPGIKLAEELGIPTGTDYNDFLKSEGLNEIINVTGSEKVQQELLELKPAHIAVIGGHSANLFWNLIDEKMRTEEELLRSEEKYRMVADFTYDWEYWLDSTGHYIYVSPSCERITGYRPDEFIAKPDLVTKITHPDDRAKVRKHFREELKSSREASHLDFRIITRVGKECWISHNCQPVYSTDGRQLGCRGSNRDISKRKRLEAKLRTLSVRDELTGLYNRRGFLTLAEQKLKEANRLKRSMLLIFADLDGMKKINYTWGHKEGDSALIDITNILKTIFRKSDIIARIGGGEFRVLAVETHDLSFEVFTTRLKKSLEAYNAEESRLYKLSLSIGSSRYYPENPCSIEELFSLADTNMYEQKQIKHGP